MKAQHEENAEADDLVARMRVRPVDHPTPQCLACGAGWHEAHAVTLPDCAVAILAARAEKVRRSPSPGAARDANEPTERG